MRSFRRAAIIAVCASGLVAGTLDIGAAALINHLSPAVIMQAIASGLLGQASFAGGAHSALLGLLLQWTMSVLIAAIYLVATARLPLLRKRWWLGGLLAGLVIQLVMVYLVVPLSAAPFRMQLSLHDYITHFRALSFLENLLAMFVFGLIIAYGAHRVSRASSDPRTVTGGGMPTPGRGTA
ncbi:MAG: hypothetical protein ACTHMO_12460 [Rhodanobacteraceae bacterium]